ncbi:hypothetical protein [Desulfitobacterium chlororespirans]|uniref:hypothetical protein n=1 Tax=Desulfitobacterium chlororespirans TaxID=51616 RepID=UPI0015B3950C|nr:hypothetical protein [Desulfitobacterium chlororespirans]
MNFTVPSATASLSAAQVVCCPAARFLGSLGGIAEIRKRFRISGVKQWEGP